MLHPPFTRPHRTSPPLRFRRQVRSRFVVGIALSAFTLVAGALTLPAHAATPVSARSTMPAPITSVTDHAGRRAGQTTITWTTTGVRTDFFRIKTALTPFATDRPGVPTNGWHSHMFTVGRKHRSVTLTRRQVAAAGAPLGSGRHLLFRVYAVRRSATSKRVRSYPYIKSADISGRAATTSGTPIRVASYNVRMASLDAGTTHSWAVRVPLIAANLAAHAPTVAAIQELLPSMWTGKQLPIGLHRALKSAGLGQYRITRATTYSRRIPGDARIVYDSTRLQRLGHCRQDRPSCGIVIPDAGRNSVAPIAKFRDRASGVKFWFVSTHLAPGNTAAEDHLRARQVRKILSVVRRRNTHHLPVILGGDLNSCQTCPGRNAPHERLLRAGFYDTSAAATQVNLEFNSRNGYAVPEQPSANGFGARLDAIMTKGMPGADRFELVRTGAPYPSDHNLVYADLRLPAR